ncbi:nitrogen regulation protein NR(II) [Saliphagus sp. LR7]|uniref:two-component system sensor histidine kinase NtrB n=1 Tax=Saliphagus sp. LR7 TaxID=2282654 RepID=UPI001E297F29|nr:PAS domain-containing sensor histidine kinase [Saliphagus sp. LR7]
MGSNVAGAPEGVEMTSGDEATREEESIAELIHPRLRDADEAFFRTLVENTSEGILTIDAESTILFANPAIERILGYEPAELVGSSKLEIIPDRLKAVHERRLQQYIETGERNIDWDGVELPARHEDGHEVPVTISLREHEFRGERLFTGIFRDVSREKAQEERLEAQNERLERFASVLSHDLRNPLNVAQGYTELIAAENEDGDGDERVEELAESLDRMEELIEDMLELAQQEGGLGTTRRLSVEEVVRETWGWVRTDDADLTVEAPGSIDADRSRLASLLENLFRNAVEHGSPSHRSQARDDAVEHGSTSNRSQAHDNAVEHGGSDVTVRVGGLEDGEGFYVEDTGRGIPEDVRTAVFEQGYTTSAEGTGIGLSIVEEVADAHDWAVRVGESEEGGARFEFRV